jgi:hypothetical protein
MNLIAIVILLFHAGKILTQKLEIHNLEKNLISIINLKSCKIKTGEIKIIHPINLTKIEETIEELTTIVERKLINHNTLTKILHHEVEKLHNNFFQLKPQRFKRWDSVGKIWKFIAGTPDAEDLKLINLTMNNLIDENNKQVKINKKSEIKINKILDIVNQLSMKNNTIILDEIEIITLILNIQLINKELEEIQDSIVKTKVKLIESKFLTIKEIIMIRNILIEQGMSLNLPEEALNFVEPKIAVSNSQLLYILSVPKLQDEEAKIIQIQPLIINGEKIKTELKNIVINGPRMYATTKEDNFIQEPRYLQDLSDETCIKPIIEGNHGKCNVTKAYREPKIIQLANNIILVNNARTNISSSCGPQNRTLQGNFLIKFENCSVWADYQEFKYEVTTQKESLFFGALQNLDITKTLIEEGIDITDLQRIHLETRETLHHVYLKQYQHNFRIWTLFGGLSTTTMMVIGLAIFLFINKQRTNTVQVNMIESPEEVKKPKIPTSHLTNSTLEIGTREDTLFHPPEELCVPKLTQYIFSPNNPDALSAVLTNTTH